MCIRAFFCNFFRINFGLEHCNMKLVVAVVLLILGCACGVKPNNLYKNKRIIKVRIPPRQYPDFYNGPKGYLRPSGSPVRFKEYHGKYPEFIRPNHPPFYNNFNNFNNIYVKHQSRPPPQVLPGPGFASAGTSFAGPAFGSSFKGFSKEVYQKVPFNYGSSYPHKGPYTSFKFPSFKDEVRIAHTQTFSAPVAPVQTPSTISPPVVSQSSSSSSSSSSMSSVSSSVGSSSYSAVKNPVSYYVSTPHAHVQSSDDNRGPIREIPAPNLAPKPSDSYQGEEYASYGKGPSIDVTNLVTDNGAQQLSFPATEYYSAFGQPQHFELINDNALSSATVYGAGYYTNNQISTFAHGVATSADGAAHASTASDLTIVSTSAPDISYKNNQVVVTPAPSPSTGYEVTEEQHSASGASEDDSSSSQFYYAPSPDPSLPVHKVPPAKEVFNDESLAETYVPHITQNFQILEGGTVPAPLTRLSTQELFNLMHGFPRQIPVIAEPIVAIVGHQQPTGVYLQPSYQYAVAGNGNEQYSHAAQAGSTNGQYQQADATQQSYVAQQQYATAYTQTNQDVSNYNSAGSSSYEHEPEASESQKRGNTAKIDEESGNSVENVEPQQENQIIIHFNKIPEVPFYTTLPNKQAAEALATLQAAGSIGSNYADRIKTTREETRGNLPEATAGDQGQEYLDSDLSDVELSQQELEQEQEDKNEPGVEIQRSIPLYETSYAASSLLDDGSVGSSSTFSISSSSSSTSSSSSQSVGDEVKSDSFGKRIRPK